MMRSLLFALLLLFLAATLLVAQPLFTPADPALLAAHEHTFLPYRLLVKWKPANGARMASASPTAALLASVGAVEVRTPLPALAVQQARLPATLRQKAASFGLHRVEEVRLSGSVSVIEALARIQASGLAEYAEPVYQYEPLFTPNDPLLPSQWSLVNAQVLQAWELTQGDPNIRIAIVDAGSPLHPDLAPNYAYNEAERYGLPGIDDDQNGYADDSLGYDFADRDALVYPAPINHGSQVAGVAGAAVNNAEGIAGVGFRSRIVPIKVMRNSGGGYINTFESVLYAADLGCQVINLSFGRVGFASYFEQEVVDYLMAVYDVLLTASSGNNNAQQDFFPASYRHVLSVCHSASDDQRIATTTRSYFIDLMAPGAGVLTTNNVGYGNATGSSFSAPFVAGLAALVRSHFPDLKMVQVGQLLRQTTDNVYGLPNNAAFPELLGSGRVNALRALQERGQKPSVRLLDFSYTPSVSRFNLQGNTVELKAEWTNYLQPTSALQIALTCLTPGVTILNGNFSAGAQGTMQSFNNHSAPFTFSVDPSVPLNTTLVFRMGFSDVAYQDYQYFYVPVQPGFWRVTFNNLTASVDADGRFGMTGTNGSGRGDGVFHSGIGGTVNLLRAMGLMVATAPTRVSDAAPTTAGTQNNDFTVLTRMDLDEYEGDFLSFKGVFEDVSQNPNPVGLEITHRVRAYGEAGHRDYLLLEFSLKNTSGAPLTDVYAGLFTDWQLSTQDFAQWDASRQTGYVRNVAANRFAGTRILHPSPAFFALDLDNTLDTDNLNLLDGFSDAEKFQSLSSGIGRAAAGVTAGGADVGYVAGANLGPIPPGEARLLAVVIAAYPTLAGLEAAVDQAAIRLAPVIAPEAPQVSKRVFCAGEPALLTPDWPGIYRFFRLPNVTTPVFTGRALALTPADFGQTFRIFRAETDPPGPFTDVRPALRTLTPELVAPATVDLPGPARFEDRTRDIVQRIWDFGDGSRLLNDASPQHTYRAQGDYTLTLTLIDRFGCQTTLTRTIQARSRSPRPIVQDTVVCNGADLTLAPGGGTVFNFYTDPVAGTLLASGSTYTLTGISTPTELYISNADSLIESERVRLRVSLGAITADFLAPASIRLPEQELVSFTDQSVHATAWEWDFGDGSPVSNTQNPVHRYRAGGTYTVRLRVTNAQGCRAEKTHVLTAGALSPLPVVASPQQACPGQPFTLIPIGGRQFNFYEAIGGPVVHTGSQYTFRPDRTPFTLYVSNADSTFESPLVAVSIVLRTPEVRILAPDVLNRSIDERVRFETIGDPIRSWLWDFGDGSPLATVANPVHRFRRQGVFVVRLRVETGAGCFHEVFHRIQVESQSPLPIVADQRICANTGLVLRPQGGLLFRFYETLASATPFHVGSQLMLPVLTETRTLFVSNVDSALESRLVPVTIRVSGLQADFLSPERINRSVNDTVRFADQSREAVRWEWRFGDGQTSEERNPVHRYRAQGTYWVRLRVSDAGGCSAELERILVVESVSPLPIVQPQAVCHGAFVQIQPQGGTRFRFYRAEQPAQLLAEGRVLLFPRVEESFAVLITNIDSALESPPVRAEVRVHRPEAAFSAPDTLLTTPQQAGGVAALFMPRNLSQEADAFEWDFGDGSPPSGRFEPVHTYMRQGRYTVTLHARRGECTSVSTRTVLVMSRSPLPTVADPALACPGDTIVVRAFGGTQYRWFATASSAEPLATGPAFRWVAGQTDSEVWVSNADSLLESERLVVPLRVAHLRVDFSVRSETLVLPLSAVAIFTDQSEGAVSWQWDFGDGRGRSSRQDAVYIYERAGVYTVSLTATSAAGCMASATRTITVLEALPPSPPPVIADTTVCPGAMLTLRPQRGAGGVEAGTLRFRFYAGWPAGQLLHEGAEWQMPLMVAARQVWVTDVSIGPESMPTRVRVDVAPPPLMFELEPNPLILFRTDTVTATAPAGSGWQWDFGDGQTYTGRIVKAVFSRRGQFPVVLRFTDPFGCVHVQTRTLTVMEVDAVGLPPEWAAALQVFPSPATERLFIGAEQLSTTLLRATLLDATGRATGVSFRPEGPGAAIWVAEVQALPRGLYWLQVETEAGRWFRKVMKE